MTKHLPIVLVIMFGFFLTPTLAYACGKSTEKTEESCCAKTTSTTDKKDCCKTHSENDKKKPN